jgi:hypothetical protein
MRAVVVEGTPEEVAAFMRSAGLTAVENGAGASPVERGISEFILEKVRGNTEKQRLVECFVSVITESCPLHVQIAIKENGSENDYLTARLTTVDESRVGNVVYCRPSSATVWFRLPAAALDGTFARRVATKKSDDEFAKVKHQVILKLANDDAVAEAARLTAQAVEMALANEW